MMKENIINFIFKWVFPPGIRYVLLELWRRGRDLSPKRRATLLRNHHFKGLHAGKRCFILGTGHSVNIQDLSPLRNEICFSLNKFYRYKDYITVNPLYHIDSGLTIHGLVNTLGLDLYKEMEQKVISETIILNYFDKKFVKRNNLFQHNKVYYMVFQAGWDNLFKRGIDATRSLYSPVYSVALMAIQIAIYMEFREIYLLGMDHDWLTKFATQEGVHCYSSQEDLVEQGHPDEWTTFDSMETLFMSYHMLWAGYRMLKAYTERKGISIYNATQGGFLDVFERVDFSTLFQ